MGTTIQMHAPAVGTGAGAVSTTVNGRTYTAMPGAPLTVPDFDAYELEANGWVITALGGTGSTAARPVNPPVRTRFHDSTLNIVVMWDGKNWRNIVSGAVA